MPGTSTVFPFCTSPDTYSPLKGIRGGAEFDTTRLRAKNGYEQRRANWATHRWSEKIGWNPAFSSTPDRDHLRQLWGFYCDRKGTFQSFPYFSFDTQGVWLLPIGTGDGVEDTFAVPARNATSRTVYDAGTPTAAGTYTAGAASYGRDEVVFSPAIADGNAITILFTGQRYGAMRFAEDKLTYTAFFAQLMACELEVVEVFGE